MLNRGFSVKPGVLHHLGRRLFLEGAWIVGTPLLEVTNQGGMYYLGRGVMEGLQLGYKILI